MKKKNLLVMAMSMVLVAAVAVGGTLAYLTASTSAVTNTFTMNGITLTLQEQAQAVAQDQAYKQNDGKAAVALSANPITYTNLVPGSQVSKEPVLTVAADSAACYVYAYVSGYDANETIAYNDAKWETVSTTAAGTLLRYTAAVPNAAAAQQLEAIFTTVTINSGLTEAPTGGLASITVEGYAHQAGSGATQAVADAAAKAEFGIA